MHTAAQSQSDIRTHHTYTVLRWNTQSHTKPKQIKGYTIPLIGLYPLMANLCGYIELKRATYNCCNVNNPIEIEIDVSLYMCYVLFSTMPRWKSTYYAQAQIDPQIECYNLSIKFKYFCCSPEIVTFQLTLGCFTRASFACENKQSIRVFFISFGLGCSYCCSEHPSHLPSSLYHFFIVRSNSLQHHSGGTEIYFPFYRLKNITLSCAKSFTIEPWFVDFLQQHQLERYWWGLFSLSIADILNTHLLNFT